MFNKSYIIWVLLLLLFEEIQAQSKIESITIVQGIVKNANGALVSSCSISVVDSSGNILNSTISDENGRFFLINMIGSSPMFSVKCPESRFLRMGKLS